MRYPYPMSRDAQIAWSCPHLVRERGRVKSGSGTFPIKGEVAGPVEVRVGDVVVPPGGRAGGAGAGWPGWAAEVGATVVTWRVWAPRSETVEVRYVSFPSVCPRCAGGLVENDARLHDRAVAWVTGPDLVFQQVAKWSVTERGSAPAYWWYGTIISSLIGSRGGATTAASVVEDEIRGVADGFRRLQAAQQRYQGLAVGERLLGLASVVATPNEEKQIVSAAIALRVDNGPTFTGRIQYAGGGARLLSGRLPANPGR